ncbi:kelch-like protein 35 [Arctopsyche grandis]|uniref:kelch-like protein 35 n=1 Tax=Arctopsyche grandis TaxID=121162 RepID=UPI00406D9F31
MSCERLGELLQSDDLNVAKEEQAFQGLKIWVQKNFESRKKHLDTLLKYIRLPLLSVQFILNEVKPFCYDSLSCCQMLLDTFEYRHNLEKRLGFPSLNSKPRKFFQQTVLIVGGEDDITSGKIEIYDADGDKWSTHHDLDNKTTNFGAVVLNNKLITMGGKIDNKTTNKVSCFNLVTKKTTELQAMQQERRFFAATVIDDRVFIFGGWNNENEIINSVERLNTMEIYDTQQDKWAAAPPMKENRTSFAAVAMGDHIYAIGGFDGLSVHKSVERFDIKSQAWISVTSHPEPKRRHKAIAFDEKIICAGGCNSKSVMEYDPGTDKWTNHESISEPRSHFNILLAPMHIMKNE